MLFPNAVNDIIRRRCHRLTRGRSTHLLQTFTCYALVVFSAIALSWAGPSGEAGARPGAAFASPTGGTRAQGEQSIPTSASDPATSEVSAPLNRGDTHPEDLCIRTSRVRFYFSRTGEWLGLFPSWGAGRSLFSDGGFFVLASNEEGHTEIVASTSNGPFNVPGSMFCLSRCCEGVKGGNRALAPNPDDDADGSVDEDRLDGIDNDADGRIDEDFAAIGDEMVVSEYGLTHPNGARKLVFHQECYAWALSHMKGMVVVHLLVENTGSEPLGGVRIGAFFEKEGPFALREEALTNRPDRGSAAEHARAVICSARNGEVVGMLLPDLRLDAHGHAPWNIGALNSGTSLETALSQVSAGGLVGDSVGGAQSGSIRKASPKLKTERIGVGEEATVVAVSPNLGTLEPGSAADITVVLIAVPSQDPLERTLTDAHRTYIGDGTHRFLPPPVSVTPLFVWGSYEKTDHPDMELVITIEECEDAKFNPANITFLSGVDMRDVEPGPVSADGLGLIIRDASAERLIRKGERIILKGRLDTGVFFDAVLHPAEEMIADPFTAMEIDELYWETPGKLPEELLIGSPNPFREQTTIHFEVPAMIEREDGQLIRFEGLLETSVKVYGVTGRLVSVLFEETIGPGTYRTDWSAVDEKGTPVASGVYYVKLQIGNRHITKRLILLK